MLEKELADYKEFNGKLKADIGDLSSQAMVAETILAEKNGQIADQLEREKDLRHKLNVAR